MGTPGKLKCLRSAFTRNLVLPPLNGSVPDTKAANVGGRTLTCVTYRIRITWRPCAVPRYSSSSWPGQTSSQVKNS